MSIQTRIADTASTAADTVRNAASNTAEALKRAGQATVSAAKVAGNFMADHDAQTAAYASAGETVDAYREKVSTALQTAVDKMENEGHATLNAPIERLANYSYTPVEIAEDASSISQLYSKAKNIAGSYHAAVTVNVEKYSRIAGEKSYAAFRALLSPVRMLFKLLQMENVGAIIQDSIALAVGFAVRGTLLALGQVLGHIAPYAAAAAVAAATATGMVLLAKASPLAAVALVLGVAIIAQTTVLAKMDATLNKQNIEIAKQNEELAFLKNEQNKSRVLKSAGDLVEGLAAASAALAKAANPEPPQAVVQNVQPSQAQLVSQPQPQPEHQPQPAARGGMFGLGLTIGGYGL